MSLREANAWFKRTRGEYLLSSLFVFSRDTGIIAPIYEQPHREMCDEMDLSVPHFGTPGQRQAIYLAPRKTYKTSLLAAFLAYLAIRYPDIRMALGRGTHQLAKDILQEIKQKLKSPIIMEVWGDFERDALTWNAEAITLGRRTKGMKEPTIQTFGLDVSLTGQHFDLIVGDDFVNETNYQSELWMRRARTVVQGFYPVLEEHGSLLLTGTRWGANDLYGWLLRQDDELEEVGEARTWRRYIRGAYDGPEGWYFPAVINEPFLAEMRRKTDPKLFSSWYLNQTHEEGMKLFTAFPTFDADYHALPLPILELDRDDKVTVVPVNVTMTIDGALTTVLSAAKGTSDLMGVVVNAVDSDDNWWVLHAEGFRKIPSEQAARVLYLIRHYLPRTVVVENAGADVNFMATLAEGIGDIEAEFELKITLQSYSAVRDEAAGRRGKAQRIEALEPRHYQGKIAYARGRCQELIRELDAWPDPVNDDVADALAMQRACAKPATLAAQTAQRDLDEEAEERASWGPDGPPKPEGKRRIAQVGRGAPRYA